MPDIYNMDKTLECVFKLSKDSNYFLVLESGGYIAEAEEHYLRALNLRSIISLICINNISPHILSFSFPRFPTYVKVTFEASFRIDMSAESIIFA